MSGRVTGAHLLVPPVTAGGQDDALSGMDSQGAAGRLLADSAGDSAAAIRQQLSHGGVVYDLAAQVVFIVQGQGHGDLAALAVGLSAAAGGVVDTPGLEGHMDGLHVLHGVAALFQAAVLILSGAGQLLPGLGQDLFRVALDAVLDGAEPIQGGVQVVGHIAGLYRGHEVAPSVAHFHQVVVDHIRAVVDALSLLPLGACAQDLAAAAGRGAAGDTLLFHNEDLRAVELGLDGRSQTGGACAADQQVHGALLVRSLRGHRAGSGFQLGDQFLARAGGLDGRGSAVQNGLAGQLRALHLRYVQGLVLHDQSGQSLHRRGIQAPADAADLILLRHLDRLDPVRAEGDLHRDFSPVAPPLAFITAFIESCHYILPFSI